MIRREIIAALSLRLFSITTKEDPLSSTKERARAIKTEQNFLAFVEEDYGEGITPTEMVFIHEASIIHNIHEASLIVCCEIPFVVKKDRETRVEFAALSLYLAEKEGYSPSTARQVATDYIHANEDNELFTFRDKIIKEEERERERKGRSTLPPSAFCYEANSCNLPAGRNLCAELEEAI